MTYRMLLALVVAFVCWLLFQTFTGEADHSFHLALFLLLAVSLGLQFGFREEREEAPGWMDSRASIRRILRRYAREEGWLVILMLLAILLFAA